MVKPENGSVWGRIDFECPKYDFFISDGENLKNNSNFRLRVGARNRIPENCNVKISYYLRNSVKNICKERIEKQNHIYCELNIKGLEVQGLSTSQIGVSEEMDNKSLSNKCSRKKLKRH
uniref:Uncharacterized protein n=1 Tax=Strongyloides papillosus TaxID=174720 RepID=A0A0N5CIW7_STREA